MEGGGGRETWEVKSVEEKQKTKREGRKAKSGCDYNALYCVMGRTSLYIVVS